MLRQAQIDAATNLKRKAVERCHRSLRCWKDAITSMRFADQTLPKESDLSGSSGPCVARSEDISDCGQVYSAPLYIADTHAGDAHRHTKPMISLGRKFYAPALLPEVAIAHQIAVQPAIRERTSTSCELLRTFWPDRLRVVMTVPARSRVRIALRILVSFRVIAG